MATTTITFSSDAAIVAKEVAILVPLVNPVFDAFMKEQGNELLALVKEGARGWRGGPEVITGRYNASIRQEVDSGVTGTTVTVGTDEPYGELLERGGTVSGPLGDIRTIAPHPHFGNAIDYLEPDFISALYSTLQSFLGGKK